MKRAPKEATEASIDIESQFVAFVRTFGLHRPEQTPCGAPVPVSEAHALDVLLQEGPVTQTTLGSNLHLAKSTTSRLVDQLERRGWVERQTGEGDGRQRLVSLTPAGRKVADEIAQMRHRRLTDLVDRIPEGERAQVLHALNALVEAARDSSPS